MRINQFMVIPLQIINKFCPRRSGRKTNLMKKLILLVGCLSLLTIGAISVSCSKDDDWKGCHCTASYQGVQVFAEDVSAEDLKEEGISSCAEAEAYASEYVEEEVGEGVDVTCTNL